MRVPKKIRVGGMDYTVSVVDNLFEGEVLGAVNSDRSIILLDRQLEKNKQKQALTLIHELLHAVCDQYHLALEDKEEQVVDCISAGIVEILRNNKQLWKYLDGTIN